MTHLRQGDKDLHDENGEHISTPPTTHGRALEAYERRIRQHLQAHAYVEQGREMGRRNRETLGITYPPEFAQRVVELVERGSSAERCPDCTVGSLGPNHAGPHQHALRTLTDDGADTQAVEERLNEYAFDAKLMVVVRVRARSEAEARKLLREYDTFHVGVGLAGHDPVAFTEATIDGDVDLFEVNGEDLG